MSSDETAPLDAATAAHSDPSSALLASPAAADFPIVAPSGNATGEAPFGMLLDLTLPVSIELGRTTMSVQDILQLGRGSVVQLDRLAGEPIDIFVGDRRFAEGEVVVLGENFGVRVTRVVSRTPHAEPNG
jgi:flagellar motor switch protein FliN